MGLFGGGRHRRRPAEFEEDVDVRASLHFNHTVLPNDGVCMLENAAYWNHSLLQDELWEAVRKARPRRGFYERQSHRASLLTTPEFMLGATQVTLLCIYLVLFHMAWMRPRYRARRSVKRGRSVEDLGEGASMQQKGSIASANDSLSAVAKELGLGLDLDEDKTPDPSVKGDDEGDSEKPAEELHHLPNSYNTPERSRALQIHSPPSSTSTETEPTTPKDDKRAPLHPSQLPQAHSGFEGDLIMSTEDLALKLKHRQAQWQKFQQDSKTKEAESKVQIQRLKTQLQQKDQQLQSTYAKQSNRTQDIASKVEQLQVEMNKTRKVAASGAPPSSVVDLRHEVVQLESDLLKFQKVAQAKNTEYSSQVQTLQTELSNSGSEGSLKELAEASSPSDVLPEDNSPETSRPPPSISNSNSPMSVVSSKALTGGTASAFRPVAVQSASTASPSSSAAAPPAALSKVKAIAEYGDLVKEVQMLTQTIQRNDSRPSLLSSQGADPTAPKESTPQHYARVLEQHLKERSGDCARLEAQVSRLQFQLSHQESEVARLRTNAKAEKVSLQAQVQSIRSSQELGQERLAHHQSQNASLLTEKDLLTKQLTVLKDMQNAAQGRQDFDWEAKLEALSSENQETIAQLQANLTIREGSCLELTAKNDSLTAEVDQCRTRLSRIERESAQRIQIVEQEKYQEQEEHRQDLSIQKEECSRLAARADSLQQEVCSSKDDFESANSKASQQEQAHASKIRALEQELETNKTHFQRHLLAKDQQREEVAEETVEVSQALQNCEDCRKDMTADFEATEQALTTKLEALQAQLQQEVHNVQDGRNDQDTLRVELDQSQQKVKDLQSTIQANDTAYATKSNAIHQKWQEQSRRFQDDLNAKEGACQDLSAKVEEIQESLDECLEELDQFHDEAKSKEIVLGAQVQSLQTELHYATKENKERLAELGGLSSQIESLLGQIEEKESILKGLAAERKDVETTLKLHIGALFGELESKNSRVLVLEDKAQSLEQTLESQDDEISQFRSQAQGKMEAEARGQELSSQVSSLQQDLEERERSYSEEISNKAKELQDLESKLELLYEVKTGLENEMEQFKPSLKPNCNEARHAEVMTQNTGPVDDVRLLIKEFHMCRERLEILQADKAKLETQLGENETSYHERVQDMDQRFHEAQTTIERQSEVLQDKAALFEAFKTSAVKKEHTLVSQVEKLRSELEDQPAMVREQLSQSESRCGELSTIVEALTMELTSCSKNVKPLEERLATKESECASLSSKLTAAELQCESLPALEEDLQRSIEEKEKVIASKISLETTLRESRTSVASLELRSSALEEKSSFDLGRKSMLQEELATLQEKSSKVAALRADLDRSQQEKKQIAKEKEALEDSVVETQKSLDSYKMKLSNAEDNQKSYLSERKKTVKEIDVLKSTLSGYKGQLNEVTDKVYNSNRQELLLSAEVREKDQKGSELRAEVTTLSEKLFAYKERASAAEIRTIEKEAASSERESKLAQLKEQAEVFHKKAQTDLEHTKRNLATVESDLEQTKHEKCRSEETREQLAITLKGLETKNEVLEESRSRSGRAMLSAIDEGKALKQELSRLKTSERKLLEESSRIPALETALKGLPALEATLKRTREQKKEALDAKAKFEQSLKEAEAKARNADESLIRKEKVVQRLFAEKKSLGQDLKTFEKKLRDANDHEAILEASVEKLTSELESKKSQMEQAEKATDQAETALQQAGADLKDCRAQLVQKDAVIKSAFGENHAMAQDLTELKSSERELQQATDKIRALEAGMEKLSVLEGDLLRLRLQKTQSDEAGQSVEKHLRESEAKAEGLQEALSRKDKVVQRVFEEKRDLNQELSAKKSLESDYAGAMERIAHLETELKQQRTELETVSAQKQTLEFGLQTIKLEVQSADSLRTALKVAERKAADCEKMLREKEAALAAAVQAKMVLEEKLHDIASSVQEQEISTGQLAAMKADLDRVELERLDSIQANQSLGAALSETKSSEEKLDLRVAKLQKDNKLYVDEKKSMAQELIELKIAAAASTEELREAKSTVESFQSRESLVETTLSDNSKQLLTLEAKVAELSEQFSSSAKRAAAAEGKNDNYAKTCSELEAELDGLKNEKHTSTEAKGHLEKSLLEHGSDAEQLQLRMSKLQEIIASRDKQNHELSLKLKDSKEAVEKTEEQLLEAIDMQQALEAGFERMHKEKLQSTEMMVSLRADLSEARSSLKYLKDRVLDLEEANKSYLDALATQESVLKELAELKTVNALVESELATKTTKLASLDGDLKHAQQHLEEKRHVESELIESRCTCESLSQKVSELEDSRNKQSGEKDRLTEQLAVLKATISKQEEGLQKAIDQVATFNKRELDHEEQVNHSKQERENDLEVRNCLEAELTEAQSTCEALGQKVSELEESGKSMVAEKQGLAQEVANLKAETTGRQEQLQQAADESMTYRKRASLAETNLNEKTKRCLDLQAKVAEQEENVGTCEKQLAESESLLLEKEKKLTEIEGQNLDLRSQLGQQKELVDSHQKQTSMADLEIKDSLDTKKTLEAELSEANSQLGFMKGEISDLVDANKSYLDALSNHNAISNELDSLNSAHTETVGQLKDATDKIAVLEQLGRATQEKQRTLVDKTMMMESDVSTAEKDEAIKKLKIDLGVLRQEKELAISERGSLSEDLTEARAKSSALEQSIIDLENAGKSYLDALAMQMTLSKELADTNEAKAKTEEQLQETTAAVVSLESELTSTKSEAQRQTEIAAVNEKLAKVAGAELEAKKNAHQETLDEIERHFVDLSDKVNVVTEKLQQKELQLEKFEEKTKAQERQQGARLESFAEQLKDKEATVANLQANVDMPAQVEALQNELESEHAECTRMSEKMQLLTTELDSSRNHLSSLQMQLDEENDRSATASAVAQQLEEKSVECNSLLGKIEELERHGQKKREEIASLQEKVKETDCMANKMESLTQELKEQQELQEKVNESITQLMKLVEEKSSECTGLKAEVGAFKKELEEKTATQTESTLEMKRQQDEKEAAYGKLSEELSDLRDQVAVHESEVNDNDEVASEEMGRLKNELQDQREQCDKLSNLNQEMQKTMGEADVMCNDLTVKLTSLSGDCKSYQETIGRLQEELGGMQGVPAAMEKLQAELRSQKENCEKLSIVNEDLERVLKDKNAKCNDLIEQMKSLENDFSRRAEQIMELEKNLKSKGDRSGAELESLKKELSEQHMQQEKMNQSMVEMLALWEEKESQCANFKSKLANLEANLENRDAQVAKLKKEVVDHQGNASRMETMVKELKQQHETQESTNESMEKVAAVLEAKEKEVAELAAKLRDLVTEHQKREQDWEIKLTRSEGELESMKECQTVEMVKSEEEKDEEASTESQEKKLSNRLGTLTSKISEGEKQLADLEREFREKWEQSAAAQTPPKGKSKKGKAKLLSLSRFRR